MATIKIKRTNDYVNSLRDYRLFIDGQKIGTIGNNQIKEFDIPIGHHSLIAKIDWCSSPDFSFETNGNDSKILLLGGKRSWRWLMPLISISVVLSLLLKNVSYYISAVLVLIPFLYILYYLTIGRKNFLTIKELNKSWRIDYLKIATPHNKRVGAISLSQFLHATWTILSWHKTSHLFTNFVKPALDSSFNRDK